MVLIRSARPADLPELVRNTLGNAWDSEHIRLDEPVVRRGTAALLGDRSRGRIFVAEVDGAVVGSCYVTFEWSDWHDAWYWWIQSVFVLPEWRRRGVYSAMHRSILTAAKAQGDVTKVRLYVEADNAGAIAAYKGHGMFETHYRLYEQPVS